MGERAGIAPDLVRLHGDWYVHAGSALADDRTRVLKQGETFAVFDRYGDIQPIGLGEQGLYHRGARHLSHLSLRVARKRPLLLSSSVSDDNALLTVDLANPEFVSDDGETVPAETLHILRTLFLWDGACHQRLDIRNYGRRPVTFLLTQHFEADFRDMFEVRGMRRERRGVLRPAQRHDEAVRLAYDGLDGVSRLTDVGWSLTPTTHTRSTLEFALRLDPGQERTVDLTFRCSDSQAATAGTADDYEDAFRCARVARREALEATSIVETSNEHFNEWLTRSRADLLMLLTDTDLGPYPFAGIPWFSTPFGRDGIIAALEALWLQPEIARGVLRYLAATQATELDEASDAQPGKILHETRRGEMATLGEVPFARYYGSVDATPLFVVLAGAYYQATADRALIDEIWPNIQRALDWIDRFGDVDGDGFVEYTPNPRALVNQGWKDSYDAVFHADGSEASGPIALCEVQAYVHAAKRAAARLAADRGDDEQAAARAREADELRARFHAAFWRGRLGTYALALDGEKRPCDVRTSNAAQCLFGGIAAPEHARRIASLLDSDAFFSGWGVRTLAAGERRYNPMSYHNGSVWPHDNALVADGLARYGQKDQVLRIFDGLFAASQTLELRRMPELFCGFPRRSGAGPTLYPVAASPQAWAAGAVFMLLRACLGLTVDAPRGRLYFDHPALPPWLEHVRIRQLRVGAERIDLEIHRYPDDVGIATTSRTGAVEVLVAK